MTDRVFDALGDPTRRRLLEHLGSTGPESASELAAEFPMSRQAIAKHLGHLEDAGLVGRRRNGRSVEYHVVSSGLAEIADWSRRVGDEWSERLRRLEGRS
ncbi:MAG TPA: metalloregulator ArsR/SmtB family transcription factor [Acidimicrobiia bacterium]|nr:metalloregulator ArsR/SmtB family transcription factor [Acidimicrobiia bacterium]